MCNISGETLRNHDTLDDLVGENRAEYEKTLQERLEKRKLRLSQGALLYGFILHRYIVSVYFNMCVYIRSILSFILFA